MFGNRSKLRFILRAQFNILAFGCELSLQKSFVLDVQLGCKDASEVKDKDTKQHHFIVDLTYFTHVFHVYFTCFTY